MVGKERHDVFSAVFGWMLARRFRGADGGLFFFLVGDDDDED